MEARQKERLVSLEAMAVAQRSWVVLHEPGGHKMAFEPGILEVEVVALLHELELVVAPGFASP